MLRSMMNGSEPLLSPGETCLLWGPGIAVPVKVSSPFIGQRQTGPLQFALD